jgi:non-ribosomal peptide synthetase component F
MNSLVFNDVVNKNDTVAQIARCSFDVHVLDIMGTLTIGATLIMLRPRGNIDFDYLTTVFREKQTSYVHTVPRLLYSFFTYLKDTNNWYVASYIRSLCSGGEPLLGKI